MAFLLLYSRILMSLSGIILFINMIRNPNLKDRTENLIGFIFNIPVLVYLILL